MSATALPGPAETPGAHYHAIAGAALIGAEEGASGPASLAVVEADAARAFALAEKAPATRRAYQSDFTLFSTWCRAGRGVEPLGASPNLVAAYLAGQASAGVKPSTLTRRLAAIGYAHKLAGLPSPARHEAVRAVLRGIRRTVGAATVPKAPATADRIAAMLAAVSADTLRSQRDRALLLLGFAGAFRRSELVALEVADLTFQVDGLHVLIRRSKADQDGQGQVIAIPRGARLRPVAAVQDWLRAAGITAGPVFRRVDRHGKARGPLTGQSVALIVKQRAAAVGLDSAMLSAHSLRSGFLTSAAEAGADVLKMMEVSRHRRVDTLQGYVRRANLLVGHAGTAFL